MVNLTTLKSKWRGLCLPIKTLEDILKAAGCTTPYVKWRAFMVEASSMIVNRQVNCASRLNLEFGPFEMLQLLIGGNIAGAENLLPPALTQNTAYGKIATIDKCVKH